MDATCQTEVRESNATPSRTLSGGRFLQRGIGKHGRAFYADELPGFDSGCREDLINVAAVRAGCLFLGGVAAGILRCGCRDDSSHG